MAVTSRFRALLRAHQRTACAGLLAVLLCSGLLAGPARAVQPDEILADQTLEARARGISAQLRCLVCQNQSIDDSDAPLARDLRLLVRERLKAGDSDSEVKSFVVARYGEYALLAPSFGLHTLLLWLAPPAFLLATLVGLLVKARRDKLIAQARRRAGDNAGLSATEEIRLADVLAREENRG